jgi:hypothetical protein
MPTSGHSALPAGIVQQNTPTSAARVLRRQASRIGASPAAGPDGFTRIGFLCLGPTGICAGHRLAPYWRGGFAGSRFGLSVLHPPHMRRRVTSSDQYGREQVTQSRHPTLRTSRGGLWSWSSTASRLTPPSHSHGSGSVNPCPHRDAASGRGGSLGRLPLLPLAPWDRGCGAAAARAARAISASASAVAAASGLASRHAVSQAGLSASVVIADTSLGCSPASSCRKSLRPSTDAERG